MLLDHLVDSWYFFFGNLLPLRTWESVKFSRSPAHHVKDHFYMAVIFGWQLSHFAAWYRNNFGRGGADCRLKAKLYEVADTIHLVL